MNETNGATPSERSSNIKVPKMQVSVQQVSDIERKVDVEIPWEEVKGRLDEAYRELKQGVTIKGFRKGKVPRKMLEQLFGKHVVKEVAQRLVQESVDIALRDNNIEAVSEPQVEDDGIHDGENFKYSASLQVMPEVDPKDYLGIEVKVRKAQVTDEAVEMALKIKQQEMTNYRAIENRALRSGDVLSVDVLGKVGNNPISLEKKAFEVGEPTREPLPGLAQALIGIPCDKEEVELELDIPPGAQADAGAAASQTEKARLLVTIHEANEKIVPELDDDFAKDTGEAETLDQLREVLRKKLLEEDEERAKNEAKVALIKQIVQNNVIPVVPALVERHLNHRLDLQKALLGLNELPYNVDEEMLKENLREDAEETVKQGILLKAIAQKESVDVQDADVEKRLAEIAKSRGQNVARVRGEYEKEGMLKALRLRITEDKTLDLLMSKANLIVEECQKDSVAEGEISDLTVQTDLTSETSETSENSSG